MKLKGAHLANLNRDRRSRRNFSLYTSLVATPQTSGAVTIPSNGRFFFVATADCAADTPVASIVGPSSIELVSPEMLEGERLDGGMLERDTVVTMEAGFELHVEGAFGKTHKIFGEA